MSWIKTQVKEAGADSLKIVTWHDGTDAEIAALLDAHYNGEIDLHDYWTVGDERTVHLNAMAASYTTDVNEAQDIVLVLTNAGGKTLVDGVTECCFQVDQKDCLKAANGQGMTTVTSQSYWKECMRRYWCNNVYRQAFPEELQPIFKQFLNPSLDYENDSFVISTVEDYFALRAKNEISGIEVGNYAQEGNQATYYSSVSNRLKYKGSEKAVYYTRSATLSKDRQYHTYNSITDLWSTGAGYIASTSDGYGIAPFGVI